MKQEVQAQPPMTDPWCRHLAQLHRALADPGAVAGFLPFSPDAELLDACAYWESLHYLLRGLLGWQDVGSGLAWWYGSGKEDCGDPSLRLMRTVWDSVGQLDFYAAWQWAAGTITDSTTFSPTEMAVTSRWHDELWWRSLKRRGHLYRHDPLNGGTNALHLGHSDTWGDALPRGSFIGSQDPAQRSAVLVVSGFESWRHELQAFGTTLPDLAGRSWNVEVFDRQVGFLGRFRQSRLTQRWFLGKHSIHMAGNPTTVPCHP